MQDDRLVEALLPEAAVASVVAEAVVEAVAEVAAEVASRRDPLRSLLVCTLFDPFVESITYTDF